MTDKPTTPVSMSKDGAPPAPARPGPPRSAVIAAASLAASAVAALIGALALQLGSVRDSLLVISTRANDKLTGKKHLTAAKLKSDLDQGVHSQLVATVVLALSLGFVAMAIYRGRHWARWGTVGVWVLSSVTGTMAGLNYLLAIGVSAPNAYKVPAFFAALFALLAVVLVNLRPSVAYFNLSRPAGRAGAAGQRRGMFAPRVPPAGAANRRARKPATSASTRPAATRPADQPDRPRSKQRANTEAVAKGAELARTRAKASKSRRTGS